MSISIFGVWRHLIVLYALTGHHAHYAPKTRYYTLQEPFWRYFRPSSPLRWTPICRSHAWSSDTIYLIQTDFTQNHVNNHWELYQKTPRVELTS